MMLLIDNYDSFTYNLVQLAGGMTGDIKVVRNDELSVEEIAALHPDHIILSPGPGYPKDAGVCEAVVRCLGESIPILGVCLGHQGICEVYGGRITHARKLMHGKQSRLQIDTGCPVFRGLPASIEAGRYHSLAASPESIPDELRIVARDELGEVMAVQHKRFPVYGVQFHPESILTPLGSVILQNFLNIKEEK
ncbi:MAG: aminodeoxychorismate/anthranilate synthase component II [Syntrophomonadaceae bacterium]